MKKLSKLVALLLAGAMAMLLLTACGGGISGENKDAEDKYMQAVNNKRGSQSLTNDPELKAKANKELEAVVNAAGYSGTTSVKIETDENHPWLVTGITTVVKLDYKGTKLDEFFTSKDFGNNNVNVNAAGLWSKVGVVVRVVNDQTYVAVSVEFKNPFKA